MNVCFLQHTIHTDSGKSAGKWCKAMIPGDSGQGTGKQCGLAAAAGEGEGQEAVEPDSRQPEIPWGDS